MCLIFLYFLYNDIDKTRDCDTDEKSKKLRQTSAVIPVKQKEKHKWILYGCFLNSKQESLWKQT